MIHMFRGLEIKSGSFISQECISFSKPENWRPFSRHSTLGSFCRFRGCWYVGASAFIVLMEILNSECKYFFKMSIHITNE